jgi:hypothetical protein
MVGTCLPDNKLSQPTSQQYDFLLSLESSMERILQTPEGIQQNFPGLAAASNGLTMSEPAF